MLRLGLTPDVSVSVASLWHKPESFPERDTLDGGIEGHNTNPLERTFEQSKGDLAPDTGPTESRADVEAPHPQRIRDYGVDRDAADGSQNLIRVRGEQRFTGSIETDDAGHPIVREPIKELMAFGSRFQTYGVEISGQFVNDTLKSHGRVASCSYPGCLSRFDIGKLDVVPNFRCGAPSWIYPADW
jgi:hypothetical protein